MMDRDKNEYRYAATCRVRNNLKMSAPTKETAKVITYHVTMKFTNTKKSVEHANEMFSAFNHGLISCETKGISFGHGIEAFGEWEKKEKPTTGEKELLQQFMNGCAHQAGWFYKEKNVTFENWWGEGEHEGLGENMLRQHFQKGVQDKKRDDRRKQPDQQALFILMSQRVPEAKWKAMNKKERKNYTRKRKEAEKAEKETPAPRCYIRSSMHA